MPDEQTQEQTTDNALASRDELIEAVREARETHGGENEIPAPEGAVEAAPAEPEKPATEPDPEEARLQALLKRREEGHAKRRDAEAYAEQIRRTAQEEADRLVREARERAQREAQEERERLRLNFRERPTEVLRELGDVDHIVDTVLKEGTPEARALAKAQEEARLAREEAKKGGAALAAIEAFKKEQAQKEQAERFARVRDEFLTQNASKTHAPALYAQHRTPDAVFLALDKQCREWEADGAKRGVDFDDAMLVKYVENESRKWLAENGFTLSNAPANQVPAGTSERTQGVATKVTANAPRTLSAAAGSERRTSPRPYHEMTPEEQRKALIDEVAAARRANPDATS